MKAISTRYLGPTNTKGARIVADDGEGNRVTVSYEYGLETQDAHAEAARALCRKLDWTRHFHTLSAGATKDGYTFVFNGADAYRIDPAAPFCRPVAAGLQSEPRAVGRRLGALLDALDAINGNVADGVLPKVTRAAADDIRESLRAEGWRVNVNARDCWQVLPPVADRKGAK